MFLWVDMSVFVFAARLLVVCYYWLSTTTAAESCSAGFDFVDAGSRRVELRRDCVWRFLVLLIACGVDGLSAL